MDYRVKTSKDLAINLAHAKAVITACRVSIPRIKVSDEDAAFIRLRIMRMISELETIDKFASGTAATVEQRRTNAKNQAGVDQAFTCVYMGVHIDTGYRAGNVITTPGSQSRGRNNSGKLV